MQIRTLDESLQIAQHASIYANRVGRKSYTFLMRGKSEEDITLDHSFRFLNENFKQLHSQQKKMIAKKLRKDGTDRNIPPPNKDFNSKAYHEWAKAQFESIIQCAKENFIGNCQELALLAMEYCFRYDHLSCELFKIEGKDHVFLIINRTDTDNEQWPYGPNAVICDPWVKKCYPATLSNMQQNLEFIEADNNIAKYDPRQHTLKFILSLEMVRPKRRSYDLK